MIWFHRTVYPWRVAASCIWLWSLTLTLLLFYHLLMFSSVFKIDSLLCMFIFITSVLLMHISQLWLLDVKVFVGRTRLQRFCHTFQLSHCLFVMLNVVMATFQSFSLMYIVHDTDNYYSTSYGSFLGLMYFVYYIKDNMFILVFNPIQQAKFFQFKTSLPLLFRNSIKQSLKDMVLYMCIYVVINMHLSLLFNVQLLWLLFVNGVMMHFVWRLSLKLHHLYQTELLEFPLIASFSEDSSRTLILGLESNNILIKYLSFMDLARLSVQSPSRRSKVYSLSTGGGPGLWINIYNNCMLQLKNFITSLGGKGDDVTIGYTPSLPASNTVTYRKGWSNEMTSPTLSRSHVYAERAVLAGHVQELHHKATPKSNVPIKSPSDQVKDAVSTLSSFKREIVIYLKKKPLISYFVTELPEQKEKELLSESLLYICIVTSLTHLAVHSRIEDKYGVVQINLPEIVKKFIELLTLLQKRVRQPFGATYSNESVNQLENGKYGLRNVLEEGLNLIRLTFPDTRFMNLTSEEKWKLSNVTGQAS